MDELREHPQVAELIETLDKNDMHKEKAEVESLVDYIGDMEKTLTEMLGEMQAMRQEINLIHNSTLKAIDTGVIPKYAGCDSGVYWFKDHDQWQDNTYVPAPGDIIFFDWDSKGHSGPQDGSSDHTGIVEKIVDDTIYTIEGNSGDSCAERTYAIGYYEILGYGIPTY